MIRKLLFVTLSISVIGYVSTQIAADIPLKTYDYTPFDNVHKPVILWDIHHVILQKNKKEIASSLWHFDQKAEVLRKCSFDMAKDMIKGVYHALTTGASAELFAAIAERHNNHILAHLITTLANTQEFIPGTVSIIQNLHNLGYRQHIGSNVGTKTFEALLRNPTMQTVFNNQLFELDASQTVTYDPSNPAATIEKPNPAFFIAYLQKNNLQPENVVFIDDNAQNVRAAQECNVYALKFINAPQLRAELWSLLGLTKNTEQSISKQSTVFFPPQNT